MTLLHDLMLADFGAWLGDAQRSRGRARVVRSEIRVLRMVTSAAPAFAVTSFEHFQA
jgi:hypothetical protein